MKLQTNVPIARNPSFPPFVCVTAKHVHIVIDRRVKLDVS